MQESKSKLFKQRLFRIHSSAGITFSIVMYISIFFGIFTILLPYISQWEKPSRHFEKAELININYNKMLDVVLQNPDFPKDNILINLPGNTGDPALTITHMFAKPISFNPISEERIDDETSKTHLGKFLNELHYGAPLKLAGRLIFGFVAIGTMALIITGLILVIKMKFQNKGKNQHAVFSKIHIKILTYVFPVLLLVSLTGAIMNVGLISSGPMSQLLTKGQSLNIDALVGSVLFPRAEAVKKENKNASMLKIQDLLKKAKEINPELTFKQLKLINWNDSSARIQVIGYNPYKPFLNGRIFNKPSVTLSATTAELITNKKVMDNTWGAFLSEFLFFLHFLFGIDIFTRILIAIIMLFACIGIGFGVMIHLEKQAKKFQDKTIFYHWLGKLSLSTMIGILPATGSLFLMQWILPFDIEDRVLIQQCIFYNIWIFTLFWSFYRINSYKASKEFFFTAGILFILAPILHLIKVNYSMSYIGIDITLLVLGISLIFISKKLPKDREQAKLFWKKN